LASKTQINYSNTSGIEKKKECDNVWDALIYSLQLKHEENIGHHIPWKMVFRTYTQKKKWDR
jgi:hypothetical protein